MSRRSSAAPLALSSSSPPTTPPRSPRHAVLPWPPECPGEGPPAAQSFAVTNQALPLLTRSTAPCGDCSWYLAAQSMVCPLAGTTVTACAVESVFFTVYALPGHREALGSVTVNA